MAKTAEKNLESLRAAAAARFEELGYPTTRHEDWRYTNVAPIAKGGFAPAKAVGDLSVPAARPTELSFGGFAAHRLVFLDGRFAPKLSAPGGLPAGFRLQSLGEALAAEGGPAAMHFARIAPWEENAFAALNTSRFDDGVFLHLSKGASVENPIHLLFVATGARPKVAIHPRLLFVAEEGSQATVVESHVALQDGEYFSNPVAEILVGPNASVSHYKIQRESAKAYHVAVTEARIERDGRYHSVSVALGASLAREDLAVALDGEGADCALDGFYLVDGSRHVDNHTTIDHRRPHGTSRELYKGLLFDSGRSVFNGKIVVRPGAQKTDAHQTNNNLILSEKAEANTKPQLEIYANDVKCKHGATIGRLDPNAVFYLLSRGIGRQEARGILAHAFADEVVNRMKIPALRQGIDRLLLDVLPGSPTLEELG